MSLRGGARKSLGTEVPRLIRAANESATPFDLENLLRPGRSRRIRFVPIANIEFWIVLFS